jgi:hypothetical protein
LIDDSSLFELFFFDARDNASFFSKRIAQPPRRARVARPETFLSGLCRPLLACSVASQPPLSQHFIDRLGARLLPLPLLLLLLRRRRRRRPHIIYMSMYMLMCM